VPRHRLMETAVRPFHTRRAPPHLRKDMPILGIHRGTWLR